MLTQMVILSHEKKLMLIRLVDTGLGTTSPQWFIGSQNQSPNQSNTCFMHREEKQQLKLFYHHMSERLFMV